jgi:hypothetical protein
MYKMTILLAPMHQVILITVLEMMVSSTCALNVAKLDELGLVSKQARLQCPPSTRPLQFVRQYMYIKIIVHRVFPIYG